MKKITFPFGRSKQNDNSRNSNNVQESPSKDANAQWDWRIWAFIAFVVVIIAIFAFDLSKINSQHKIPHGIEGVSSLCDSMVVAVENPVIPGLVNPAKMGCQPAVGDTLDNIGDFALKLQSSMEEAQQKNGAQLSIPAINTFFELDNSNLGIAGNMLVHAFAEAYCMTDKKSMIEVSGFACDLGEDAYNMSLSRERCLEAKDLLVQYGVPSNKIRLKPFGKTRNKEYYYPDGSLYRRVIISIVPKES